MPCSLRDYAVEANLLLLIYFTLGITNDSTFAK